MYISKLILKAFVCTMLVSSCCLPLLPGRERRDEDIRISTALQNDKEVANLLKNKKLDKRNYPRATGDACSSVILLDFNDEKKPARKILYSPEEAYFIAKKVQQLSRELHHSVRIDIVERSTDKNRYVIGSQGRYLKIK